MRLSVIIVNYNVKYFLEQCLCSVIKATKDTGAEILVADNNSTDGSIDYLKPRFPHVKFVANAVNLGFAKANNQLLEMATGQYILFLNPDTMVPEDCIEKCIAFLESHPLSGALGIRMIDGTGKFLKESKRAFPSPLTSLYKLSGLTGLFPRSEHFARYHLGHLAEKENHEVDVLAGAFIMITRKILDEVGYFDESFFMYGEDIDLSYRIQKAGYRNYYFSESTILHFKGESSKKGSLNYIRMFYKAMSLFVRKHYKGPRARFFNFLIEVAIWGRALLSATGKLLKQLGLPLFDAGVILMSFWIAKYYWGKYIRQEVNYSPQMLTIAFPIFTFIFLIVSIFSGLYDRNYKLSRLNRSTLSAALILLSSYALLPENYRFSRGILVFGIGLCYLLISISRWLFIKMNLLKHADEEDEHRQTIIVSNERDFEIVKSLMTTSGMQERVLGRVNNNSSEASGAMGTIQHLPHLLKMYPIKEVIFCEDELSFKSIIETIQQLVRGVRYKFHAAGSMGIVGSDNKHIGGEYFTRDRQFIITHPANKRNKDFFDIVVSLFFMVTFPFHFILQKRPLQFFRNSWDVLKGKKSWVGYALEDNGLPYIKPGIISSTSLPRSCNTLPAQSLQVSDEWYAAGYSIDTDLSKIWRGYKYLSN